LAALQRIGIFGGSFDPVHWGHLLVAQAATEELALDRLFFVPAAQSPFKRDQPRAPAADRARLLRLALAGRANCEVDEQELQRGGVSYTVDTLRDYARRFSEARRFYLIGADNVPHLPKWREADELAQLAEFVAISRPGEQPAAFPPSFRGQTVTGFPLGVSSSQIRARVKAGLSVDALVPLPVAEALCNSRLYL
jgi:nicotinate-nucleotide adenylyltransferase